MILLDTNVLVGLIDRGDRLSPRCYSDLGSVSAPFGVIDAAIVEAHQVLDDPYLSKRIPGILQQIRAQHVPISAHQWRDAFDWMDKYSQHEPDICDALLIATGLKIWTYDREFVTIWRAADGSLVSLAMQP